MTKVTGHSTFNTFVHIWRGAESLLETSKACPTEGAGYCRLAATIMAAFAIEAASNHIASVCEIEKWDERDSWKDKLKKILKRADRTVDWNKPPFTTATALFDLRDGMAHGRTHETEVTALKSDPFRLVDDPAFLQRFEGQAEAESALADTKQLIELMLHSSKLPPLGTYPVGVATAVGSEIPPEIIAMLPKRKATSDPSQSEQSP
jgi:hypothetical protein